MRTVIFDKETPSGHTQVELSDGYAFVLDLLASPHEIVKVFDDADSELAIEFARDYHKKKSRRLSEYLQEFERVHGFIPAESSIMHLDLEDLHDAIVKLMETPVTCSIDR